MAAGATYEPIATQTLASAAASITFSSIPATYTDLRLVLVATSVGSGTGLYLRFNGTAGSGYSQTNLSGNGSSATSSRLTSNSLIRLPRTAFSVDTTPDLFQIDIFSYAGSTYKTSLLSSSQDNNGSGEVNRDVALWQVTSAITTILISTDSNTMDTGTTATLYGIKAA